MYHLKNTCGEVEVLCEKCGNEVKRKSLNNHDCMIKCNLCEEYYKISEEALHKLKDVNYVKKLKCQIN
jgi:hypothetical protein